VREAKTYTFPAGTKVGVEIGLPLEEHRWGEVFEADIKETEQHIRNGRITLKRPILTKFVGTVPEDDDRTTIQGVFSLYSDDKAQILDRIDTEKKRNMELSAKYFREEDDTVDKFIIEASLDASDAELDNLASINAKVRDELYLDLISDHPELGIVPGMKVNKIDIITNVNDPKTDAV
jgi:hypothetical protein